MVHEIRSREGGIEEGWDALEEGYEILQPVMKGGRILA
jgi:hypothetical protein